MADYDPFAAGKYSVNVRTVEAHDAARDRTFPVEIWQPTEHPGRPLVVFSHYSGGNRRVSSFLCTHLASHGYVVAAMDHSEVVAPQLARKDCETKSERAARIDAIIASRVPDVRFLLDHLLARNDLEIDSERIGLVGHSFGGWTVLATPEVDSRVGSVVAMAPGGSSNPRPGILPLILTFKWAVTFPRSTWPASSTFRSRLMVSMSCSTARPVHGGCSCCGVPTTITSSTKSKPRTKPYAP